MTAGREATRAGVLGGTSLEEVILSGLVAVVAAPGAEPVVPEELHALLADYAALRGPAHHRCLVGNGRVRAASMLSVGAAATGRPCAEPPSFVLSIGRMHPADTWVAPHRHKLEAVDGQFAMVSFDEDEQQVVLANDPMGMQPLYVIERPGRIYASTSVLVLARHLRPPASTLGLQTFLLAGYHFGTRTHWDGIERLNPATSVVVSGEGVERCTYWQPQVDRRAATLPLQPSVDLSLDVARSTLTTYLGAREHWADLTGGFDSRLLCLLLASAGVRFSTNTRSDPSSQDLRIARSVAQRAGWQWVDASLPDDWPLVLPDMLRTALVWGDSNLEVLQLSRVLHPHQLMAQVRPRLLLGGGGEHFQYYGWQSEFLRAGRSDTFDVYRWIDMIGLKPVAHTGVLRPDPRAGIRDDYCTRLLAWVEPYRGERNTTQLELMHAYKSTGHFGAYRAADLGVLETELPFHFKPIFSTAISMNHRHRNGHRLMRRMITRLNPHVAAIDTTRGGPAVPFRLQRAHRYVPYLSVIGRKGVNKLSAKLPGPSLLPPKPAFPWQEAANSAVLTTLGGSGMLDWPQMRVGRLLDEQRLVQLVHSATLAGFHGNAMLGRILTAEMALRETDTALP